MVCILAACEVPQAPHWDVGVLVPLTEEAIAIDSLLPERVRADEVDGEPVFIVDTDEEAASYALGTMCPACGPLHGTNAPVPGFQFEDTFAVNLPTKLLAVDIFTTTLGFRIVHGFDFDPLRPHTDPDSAGWIRIHAIDQGTGTVLDSATLSGATETFPSGTPRELVITVQNTRVTDGIFIAASVNSPFDGQTAVIDTSAAVDIETISDSIVVASLVAEVASESIREDFEVDFDEDVRNEVMDRVNEATIELRLQHAVEVEGQLEVSLAGSPAELFSGSSSEVRLGPIDLGFAPDGRTILQNLTEGEIQFLLTTPDLFIGYSGVADAMATDEQGRPAVTFTPADSIVARMKVTATVEASR
jgi:hypothetical protein